MNFRQFGGSSFRWSALGCLLLAACTIIKDTDITSQDQISTLKLRSVQFIQDANSGSQSINAPVTLDAQGRIGTISVPPLAPHILQYRSQLTDAVTMEIGYDSINGKLGGVFVRPSASQSYSETYRFRYDNSGRLQKIITNIYIGLDTLHTKDSLIYTSGRLTSMERSAFDPAKRGTITITMNATSNSVDAMTYLGQNYSLNQGNCSNGLSWSECGGYNVPILNGAANVNYNFSTSNSLLDEIILVDNRQQNNGGGGGGVNRDYDTYYFHPLMLFPDQFELGKQLMLIYQIDWWVVGGPLTSLTYTKSDKVTFKFNYGL